jgi:hypothetical protein
MLVILEQNIVRHDSPARATYAYVWSNDTTWMTLIMDVFAVSLIIQQRLEFVHQELN